VIIGRAENDDVGAIDSVLQLRVSGHIVRDVGIVKRQRFLFEIQDVDFATVAGEIFGDFSQHNAGDRLAVEAADDRQDLQLRFCHLRERYQSVGAKQSKLIGLNGLNKLIEDKNRCGDFVASQD